MGTSVSPIERIRTYACRSRLQADCKRRIIQSCAPTTSRGLCRLADGAHGRGEKIAFYCKRVVELEEEKAVFQRSSNRWMMAATG